MLKITLGTNTVRPERLSPAVRSIPGGVDIAVTSTTAREIASRWDPPLHELHVVPELWVMGESPMGVAVLGDESDRALFEAMLDAIGNGSFPKPGQRDKLSHGQRNQMRDAMIFCTHVREGRDIFVTNDVKAFGVEGNTQRQLVSALVPQTRIMTLDEFERFCTAQRA